ncbi:hypothetical protein NQ315_017201 [Exocentrus adspersus]|uniref:Acireductone dioxygenase n=1 Tax=Exocentrus adspersus TaxID=1586481 RepID=A0AAV8V9F2_9CUCU|nr:hypothetical protein NQ315_017201 [Exocentrus adspersus]
MVRAWYMDDEVAFPRKEHHRIPPKFVTLEELYKTSGVEYFHVSPDCYETDSTLKELIEERGNNIQQIVDNPNEEELKQHFTEHFHTDDEFRLVLEGCGYFDIRDKYDEWIRVEVLPGDLLVIPGGCYHRFIVDNQNAYKGLRILKDEVYQAHKRPSEDLECRKLYIRKLYNGAFDEPREEINLI